MDGVEDDDFLFLFDCAAAMVNSFKCPHLAILERYRNCTNQNLRWTIGPRRIPIISCGNVSNADRKDDSSMTSRTNVDMGVIRQDV